MSENELPNQNSNCSEHPMDYLSKAAEACAAGDMTLGLHLYLAAYEKAVSEPGTSTGLAVAALREAWHLACDLKERSMAEHVFEKLEPYLTREEIAECAARLQDLALDRLEQYGFSREELQDMAEAISHDFLGADASVVKVEHITFPSTGAFGMTDQLFADVSIDIAQPAVPDFDTPVDNAESTVDALSDMPDDGIAVEDGSSADGELSDDASKQNIPDRLGMGVADVFNPYDYYPSSSEGTSWRAATNVGSGWSESIGFDGTTAFDKRFEGFSPVRRHEDESEPTDVVSEAETSAASTASESIDAEDLQAESQLQAEQVAHQLVDQLASEIQPSSEASSASPAIQKAKAVPQPSMPSMPDVASVGEAVFNYASLVGYDEAVSIMRDYGFGLQHDPGFVSFVRMLNERHGLSRMPAADTILFRAPAIEDAARFVEATIGELGLPSLRMSMEDGIQGMPMLCVTTDSGNRPRMNRQQNRFQGPAVLVIDDLDMWRMPETPENIEGGMQAFVLANMSRGAREAVNLIRSAVEDPDVFVLATSTMSGEVDPFFYEVLEPLTIIDIGNPTEHERGGIWAEIMQNHPSTRELDIDDLVRFSAGMARYDIYVAAREAIEEAYKMGLVQRNFVPVSSQNILDKLASCQPFDSDEYHALEEKVVSDFVNSLDDLEQLLGGQGE